MQGDKTMLKLASSLGFMYWILFFASVTDISTLMAWNIRQSKDDAFSSNLLVSLAYLSVKGQNTNVSGWEQRIFSVWCSGDIRGQQCRAWWRWCPYDSQIPRNDAFHIPFIRPSYGLHMAFIRPSYGSLELLWERGFKGVAELGPVPWPYRGRYLTRVLWPNFPDIGYAGWTFLLVSRIWNPFEDLAANRKLPYPLGFASLLTTVDSVRHDFSFSLQMQGDKTMLKLASSLGFMYWILFFASVTDISTLMAWNIRQSKDDAFSSNLLLSLAYLSVKGQNTNVSGWEQRIFSVWCSGDIRGQQCRAWWRWCPYDSQIPRNDAFHIPFIRPSYGLHTAFIWPSYGLHMGLWSCCESEVLKGVAELGPVPWPYRGRYLTRVLWPNFPDIGYAGWTFLLVSRIWNPFEDLAANRKLPYPLGFASLLTTVDSVRHDFSFSLQMQGDKTMLKLASSLGFMYWILFFASVTDISTLMAWTIRQSKDDAFSSNLLVSLAYLSVKGQNTNVSGWEQRIFSVWCSGDIRGQQCRAWWRWCPYDSQIPRNDAFHIPFIRPSYGRHTAFIRPSYGLHTAFIWVSGVVVRARF